MKKFYAFAAALFMGLAAFAQNGEPLYIVGQYGTAAWDPATPDQFDYVDGVYTFYAEGCSMFKLSTAYGDWDTFNEAAIGYPETPEKAQTVTVALEAWGENTFTPYEGNWTLMVSGDLTTLTMTTEDAVPTGATAVYIRGDINSWGTDEAWEMTCVNVEDGADVYKFTCADDQEIAAGDGFKFADSGWAVINLGAEAGSDGKLYLDDDNLLWNNGSSGNCQVEEDWNGVCYLDVTNALVFLSNDKDAENPYYEESGVKGVTVENNSEAVYYNLQGVKVATPESGLYIKVQDGKAVKFIK